MAAFVGYLRVSTQQQGQSGLGLEAQRNAVETYARQAGGTVATWFTEIESGKRSDRPKLAQALSHCRRAKGTLVVAKLDRLSRDPDFLGELMKADVNFICCDMPSANKLTIRIMAAVAEQEREAISQRTKVALAAYKARGGLLGGQLPQCRNLTNKGREKGWALSKETRTNAAVEAYADLLPIMHGLKAEGLSLRDIAAKLNGDGYTTRTGKPWNPVQVSRVLERAGG